MEEPKKEIDQKPELNVRDLFFQEHGIQLFEETNIKLILLLQDAFYPLPFHDWYQWRPKSIKKLTKCHWQIEIDCSKISKLISNWLNQQLVEIKKNLKYLIVHVTMKNFLDSPRINSCIYSSEKNTSFKQHKIIRLNTTYATFCINNKDSKNITKVLQHLVDVSRSLYQAKWFFKEGFYIAPSLINGAGYGLFSLTHVFPGQFLFLFDGKKMTPEEFQLLPLVKRIILEEYIFEASFLISPKKTESKQQEIEITMTTSNYLPLIVDPTNDEMKLTLDDMLDHPNPGPWINEPTSGQVSNVFMQPFTYFELPEQDKNRYVLQLISARHIYPHEEMLLHYEGHYCRKHYTPGEKCPDLLD